MQSWTWFVSVPTQLCVEKIGITTPIRLLYVTVSSFLSNNLTLMLVINSFLDVNLIVTGSSIVIMDIIPFMASEEAMGVECNQLGLLLR